MGVGDGASEGDVVGAVGEGVAPPEGERAAVALGRDCDGVREGAPEGVTAALREAPRGVGVSPPLALADGHLDVEGAALALALGEPLALRHAL